VAVTLMEDIMEATPPGSLGAPSGSGARPDGAQKVGIA
jgi:hypothetical protein